MIKLFTTLYGSTLYGTNTPESDRDIKHIVLPEFRSAILGEVPKNKVKGNAGKKEGEKNSATDIDEEFIPIQIFAKDFMLGQTYALELAYAIEFNNAEQDIHNPDFLTFCRQLREKFMTSSMDRMIGYAVNQATLYSNKGERLNAANDCLDLLKTFSDSDTQMIDYWPLVIESFGKLAERYPTCIKIGEYQINPQGQMRPCIYLLERVLSSTASFTTVKNTVKSIIDKYGARAKAATADQVDWKATSHALRIINEGIDLLTGQGLVYPYPAWYKSKLLLIKTGKVDHTLVMEEISCQMDRLKTVQAASTLPPYSFALEQEMKEWLYNWLLIFYGETIKQIYIPITLERSKQ